MTPEIEAIDQEIMRLKALKGSMVPAAKKKADAVRGDAQTENQMNFKATDKVLRR
jgi:hypothetical protein